MGWFRKRPPPGERPPVLPSPLPRDEERLGPALPPPRSATPPCVTVVSFGELPPRLLLGRSAVRPSGTWLAAGEAGAALGVAEEAGGEVGALVLSGSAAGPLVAGPGDLLFGSATEIGALAAGPGGLLLALLDVAAPDGGPATGLVRVGREELVGSGFTGITGIRTVHRTRGVCGLRLGPPPGARWIFVGLRAVAVFSGKLTLYDGDEPREVRAESLAVVADPSATLFVEAGNDSAFAIGFASPDVTVALG